MKAETKAERAVRIAEARVVREARRFVNATFDDADLGRAVLTLELAVRERAAERRAAGRKR